MVVKLALKRKNENIQIWSRYSLFKNPDCSLPASSSAALTGGFLWSKASEHSRRMRNQHFFVSHKKPMGTHQSLFPTSHLWPCKIATVSIFSHWNVVTVTRFQRGRFFPQTTLCDPVLILGSHPTNERRRYKVTPSLILWAQTWNHTWVRCKYTAILHRNCQIFN